MFPDRNVIGVDITSAFEEAEKFAKEQLSIPGLPRNLNFCKICPGQSLATITTNISAIYTWSVFEHVDKNVLQPIILDMHQSLNENGVVFFQVAPLFFSPFGSHLKEYISRPWAHLELSHASLRDQVEIDDVNISKREWMFSRYEELNKLTAQELLDYFVQSGFTLVKNETKTVSHAPPKELARIYGKTLLTTNEIVGMAQKMPN